jgi:hypothetical protein
VRVDPGEVRCDLPLPGPLREPGAPAGEVPWPRCELPAEDVTLGALCGLGLPASVPGASRCGRTTVTGRGDYGP